MCPAYRRRSSLRERSMAGRRDISEVQLLGVIGAGIIGRGVTQALAQTGHTVVLLDITQEALELARVEIGDAVRLHGLFSGTRAVESSDAVFRRITFSTDYQLLSSVDFVIENVTEDWETKRQVYAQLDAVCRDGCILAANTSAIPIARIAALTERAPQVLGMHFMNPVPLTKAVEVVRSQHTSEQTLRTAQILLDQMGKEGIVVNDSPGFVSNRVLMLAINEAICVVQENVASAKDVDRLFRVCFAHKMGPLEAADLIGLDTVLYTLQVLHESFGDQKYKPSPLLEDMVQAGLCGRKSGQGFYTYARHPSRGSTDSDRSSS